MTPERMIDGLMRFALRTCGITGLGFYVAALGLVWFQAAHSIFDLVGAIIVTVLTVPIVASMAIYYWTEEPWDD